MTGTSFLHAYYKIFSQFFIDDSTNLISLYSQINPDLIFKTLKPIFKICFPFRDFTTNSMTIVILVKNYIQYFFTIVLKSFS